MNINILDAVTCSDNIPACSQICRDVEENRPNVTCDCHEGYELQDNGRTCKVKVEGLDGKINNRFVCSCSKIINSHYLIKIASVNPLQCCKM